jgi:hypothetical protein
LHCLSLFCFQPSILLHVPVRNSICLVDHMFANNDPFIFSSLFAPLLLRCSLSTAKAYMIWYVIHTCCTSAQVKSLHKRPQIRNIWERYLQPDVQLVLYVKFLTHFQQVPDDGLQTSRKLFNTWHYCSNMTVIDSGFVHLFIHVTAGSLAHRNEIWPIASSHESAWPLTASISSTKSFYTSVCTLFKNKIKWYFFSPSEHYNIYNHQHPCMATFFGPFLDHPQANM